MKTLVINQEHIAILKEHRFFALRPNSFADYESKHDSIGWIKVGSQLQFRSTVSLEPYSAIYVGVYQGGKGAGQSSGLCTIGSMSYSHSPLPEKMTVGRYCSIGEGLKVLDSHHPISNVSTSHFTWRKDSPAVEAVCKDTGITLKTPSPFPINGYKPFPVIMNDVWVGQNVTLSMGVTIGNGAVIAANSVVTKSVPDFGIVGGNPAKLIKYRFTEYQRAQLKEIQWWNYLFSEFHSLESQNVFNFLRQWREQSINFKVYKPKPLVLPDDLINLG
jgi:acetyltransferase-like isoleucine patch superfamily enzyme